MKIEWIDSGREPQQSPDPAYPTGKDIDISDGAAKTCFTELPYPAKRCGVYRVQCEECGFVFGITTAGRLDDPRSVKVPCKTKPH